MAEEWAKLSHCKRRQVGALIVKDKMIISDGYNGTPTGFENPCEDDEGYTKWYVLHAEANAIAKVSGSTQSTNGATLYITLSPCRECSKLIFQSGIKRIVYSKKYKDQSGIEFLLKSGVEVDFIESKVSDHSGIEAINNLVAKYVGVGKSIKLKHLSPECKVLLLRSNASLQANIESSIDDPRYHVVTDSMDREV